MEQRRVFSRKDLLIVAALIAAAALFAWTLQNGKAKFQCEVYIDGAYVRSVDLSEDKIFSLPEAPEITLEIREGKICVLHSDCPDQVCVRTGFISREGQYIVCLPHRLMLKIPTGDPQPAVDGIVGLLPRFHKEEASV